jgi:hypothetical protein
MFNPDACPIAQNTGWHTVFVGERFWPGDGVVASLGRNVKRLSLLR